MTDPTTGRVTERASEDFEPEEPLTPEDAESVEEVVEDQRTRLDAVAERPDPADADERIEALDDEDGRDA